MEVAPLSSSSKPPSGAGEDAEGLWQERGREGHAEIAEDDDWMDAIEE